ncbi:hypothetical protein ACIBO2_09470 [Nonomuraea sp. NPDC050022]|uniref:hypothetical protein n=1 Tax=unclassified Nonomuraea TaxID=2593643 RepID=UPI0033EE891C
MDFEIRASRERQGPKKLTCEREAYFRPMDQGFSSREACRIVGINIRTGKRWRNGSAPNKAKEKGAPPTGRPTVPPSDASRYLRDDERIYIADRVREKASIREIARAGSCTLDHQPGDPPQPAPHRRPVLAARCCTASKVMAGRLTGKST